MSKLESISKLLEKIKNENQPEYAKAEMSIVNDCIMSYVRYHNEAVEQGAMIAMARFRLDDSKFHKYIENLHNRRKDMHEEMIDRTAILNETFNRYGMNKIYTGKLDTSLGRQDPDTRFGVAAFAEELCKDFFKTTHEIKVTEKAKTAYLNYAEKVDPKASMLDKILNTSKAKADMDSSQPSGPSFL